MDKSPTQSTSVERVREKLDKAESKLLEAAEQQLKIKEDLKSQEGLQDSKHEGDVGNVKKSLPHPTWEKADSRTEAACEKCERSMNGPAGTTGRCAVCFPSSKVVDILPNGSYKLINRRERRHPSGKVKGKR